MDDDSGIQRRRRPKNGNRGPSAENYASKALTRALDVLECFSDEYTALSLKELTSRYASPESSLYRTLITLESRGYLIQGADGTYRISPRLLYGKVREVAEKLRNVARPHLENLSTRFDETASLSYLFEDRIQVVDTVEPLHSMRLTNRPGRLLPPHCSAITCAPCMSPCGYYHSFPPRGPLRRRAALGTIIKGEKCKRAKREGDCLEYFRDPT